MLPNWGFRNTVHAYHADSETSIRLPLKNLTDNEASSFIPLNEFVKSRVPEIKNDATHTLKPYLFNGTLQTLYTFKAVFHNQYPVYFGRQIIEITSDNVANSKPEFDHLHAGQFTLDIVVDPPTEELNIEVFKQKYKETLPEGYPNLHPRCRYYTDAELDSVFKLWKNDDKPISIIIPGLAGGIQEAPVRATCYKLHNEGHHVVVLNQRGASRSKITTPYLYTGLDTDDIKYVLHRFHKVFADTVKRQFHAIGYSFGGLQIMNYLAKEGKDSKLTSAVTVSSPWDLTQSMSHILSSISGRMFFDPAVRFFLMKMVKSNMATLTQRPDIFTKENYEALKKRMKCAYEFDDQYTCKLVGIPSGKLYYYAASPALKIFRIKTPLLVINSNDDPMVSTDYPWLDVQKHPWIYMATADLGGHYSFIKSDGDFWFPNVIENWIQAWSETTVQTPHDVDDNDWNLDFKYTY